MCIVLNHTLQMCKKKWLTGSGFKNCSASNGKVKTSNRIYTYLTNRLTFALKQDIFCVLVFTDKKEAIRNRRWKSKPKKPRPREDTKRRKKDENNKENTPFLPITPPPPSIHTQTYLFYPEKGGNYVKWSTREKNGGGGGGGA